MKAAERESGKVVSGAGEICGVDWLWVLPLTAALIALAVIFHPLSVNLATIPLSGSTNESLGVFALLLSGWLVWRERERLKNLPAQPDAWGLVFLLLGALVAIAGYRLVMRFALGVALVLIATGAVWWLWGRHWVRHLWFPLLLLVAIVPLPLDLVGAIAFRMQTIVARYAAFLAGLFGVPVERVGVTLNIPGHVIQVNEACSGWHSFSAAFWLFLLLLYWQRPQRWWQWLWVIPVLFPIAIVSNIFRVTTVVVSAANGFDLLLRSPWHEMLGLGYFLLLVWLLFRYAIKWQSEGTSNVVFSATEAKGLLPARSRAWQLTGLLWVFAGLVLWTGWQMGRAASNFKPPEIPKQLGEWKLVWENVEGLDDGYWFAQARYEAKGQPPLQILLHIPIENRHRPKRLLNLWLGQGYELVGSETLTVDLPHRQIPAQLVRFAKGQEIQFVAVTYLHPKRAVTSPVSARWHRMQEQLLFGVSKPWLAVGVAGSDDKSVLKAFRTLAAKMDEWLKGQQ
jgi:exosortase